MDVEAEIRSLKRRVGELEGSFTFLSQQVKAVHTDLLSFHAAVTAGFVTVNAHLERHDSRFDHIEGSLDALRRDMPDIVANAAGEALRRR